MTAEQLEELLAMLDNGHTLDPGRAMDELFDLAPLLARKVIAADKLARAACVSLAYYFEESGEYIDGMTELLVALTAYRDASK